jgi:hypothetical protein
MREPFHVVEQHNLLVARRHLSERPLQINRICAKGHWLWSRQMAVRYRVDWRVLYTAQLFAYPVDQHSGKPGPNSRLSAESGNPGDRPKPRVVHSILGIRAIAEATERNRVEHRRVASIQKVERQRICVLADPPDELPVVLVCQRVTDLGTLNQ